MLQEVPVRHGIVWTAVVWAGCGAGAGPGLGASSGVETADTGPLFDLFPGPEISHWDVKLNEVVSRNEAGLVDELGEREDWLELYNYSDGPMDLTGWTLTDAYEAAGPRWPFPDGTVVQPGTHLVIFCDAAPEEGPFHTTFSIDGAGDALTLISFDEIVRDHVVVPELPVDLAWARVPSGGTYWQRLDPTPGAVNPGIDD